MGLYRERNAPITPEERRRRKRERWLITWRKRERLRKMTPAQRRRAFNAEVRERLRFLKKNADTVSITEPLRDEEQAFYDRLIAVRAEHVRLSRPAGWRPEECNFEGPTSDALEVAGATLGGSVHPLVSAGRQPRRTLRDQSVGPSQPGIRVIDFAAIQRRGGLPAR